MKKNGFTLIELLVVISIIGMLSSIVLSAMNTARAKARDSQRIQSLIQLRNALEMYYSVNGQYPKLHDWGTSGRVAAMNQTGEIKWETSDTEFYDAIVGGKYISSLPQDPSRDGACTGGSYLSSGPSNCRAEAYFTPYSNQQCYILGTNLENPLNSSHQDSWCGNYQIIGGNCADGCKTIFYPDTRTPY